MKKILSAILVLALSCTVLASCSTEETSPIDAIYNAEWSEPEQFINKCEELKGITGTLSAHNDGFLVFRDATGKNAVTYVWSNYENKIVGVYADTDTVQNNISLPSTRYSAVYLNHKLGDGKASLTMYNGKGEECEKYEGGAITEVSTAVSSSPTLGLLLFRNKTLYQEKKDGTVEKLHEFTFTNPPAFSGSGALQAKIGEYYYTTSNNPKSVTVYDKDFNSVFYYTLPSYAFGSYSNMAILNDGKILSQITTVLPEDAVDYSFTNSGAKYSLKTYLTDPASGEVTELSIAGLIRSVTPLLDDGIDYNDGMYAEGLENIAQIAYITADKLIDTTGYRMDLVSFGNDGTVGASLKVDTEVAELPQKLSGGYYKVDDIHGTTLILDATGAIVNRINNSSVTIAKDCLYDANNIYNFKGEVIFKISEIKGTVIGILGGNPIVTAPEKGTYIYRDGEMVNVTVLTGTVLTDDFYSMLENSKTTYYNAKGDKIVTADSALSIVAVTSGGYILRQDSGVYYKFSYNTVLK